MKGSKKDFQKRKKQRRARMRKARGPTKMGRKVLDTEQVRRLAVIGCSQLEIATVLGCGVQTLQRRMKEEPAMRAAYEAGQVEQFINLRRLQWRHARSMGGTAMTIHLSKHLLNQHDKSLVMQMSVEELDALIGELERRMRDVNAIEDRTQDTSDTGESAETAEAASATARKGAE